MDNKNSKSLEYLHPLSNLLTISMIVARGRVCIVLGNDRSIYHPTLVLSDTCHTILHVCAVIKVDWNMIDLQLNDETGLLGIYDENVM
jgi:hypothetical protein